MLRDARRHHLPEGFCDGAGLGKGLTFIGGAYTNDRDCHAGKRDNARCHVLQQQ